MLNKIVTQPQGVRRAFVKSFGCQMNVYDSQRMADIAESEGYAPTDDVNAADLVILNTCHIREHAVEKVFSELGRLRELKEARRAEGLKTTIVVAGCVAQAEGAEIVRRQSAVDLVVGPQAYHRLPKLLSQAERESVVDTDFPVEDKFDSLPAARPETLKSRGASAFVTVQEGCDKFCTFCVVPYTRGAESSRAPEKVLAELERLAAAGVVEATLIGQNVNAYRGAGRDGQTATLAELLARAARIDALKRLRYQTSHPIDMGADLIAAHRDNEKLAPYLHLPAQSGSDRILKAMNRRHAACDYLDVIADARRARPDLAISSDFIVGFPGETEEDFAATLELARRVAYASAYVFKYSPRPGTPAEKREDQIDEDVKAARHAVLQGELDAQRLTFNRQTVGKTFEVLFDREGRRKGQALGRSPYMQSVHLDAEEDVAGRMMRVEIVAAGPNSLHGRPAP